MAVALSVDQGALYTVSSQKLTTSFKAIRMLTDWLIDASRKFAQEMLRDRVPENRFQHLVDKNKPNTLAQVKMVGRIRAMLSGNSQPAPAPQYVQPVPATTYQAPAPTQTYQTNQTFQEITPNTGQPATQQPAAHSFATRHDENSTRVYTLVTRTPQQALVFGEHTCFNFFAANGLGNVVVTRDASGLLKSVVSGELVEKLVTNVIECHMEQLANPNQFSVALTFHPKNDRGKTMALAIAVSPWTHLIQAHQMHKGRDVYSQINEGLWPILESGI